MAYPTNNTWYAKTAHDAPARPVLSGHREADVAILGAGYTGLAAALALAERGYRVAVVDALRIGDGASGRNGGQIVTGFNPSMTEMEHLVGQEDAHRLWALSAEARDLLTQTIARFKIECDLTWGYVFAAANARQTMALSEMAQEWTRYGHPGLQSLDRSAMEQVVSTKRYVAGLRDPLGGHLHPLNYALGLAAACEARGVEIYENSPVLRVDRGGRPTLHTALGRISAKHLVIAGNALLGRLVPTLARKIASVGSYILATAPLGATRMRTVLREDVAIADLYLILNYFRRTRDHRLLFGARVSYSGRQPLRLSTKMRASMLAIFPQLHDAKIDYVWGGLIDITMNRLPHLGRLDPTTYFAHGFSGQGVALSGMAGRVIAEAIDCQHSRFDAFARIPHHAFPGGPMRRPALMLGMLWYRLRELI